MSVTEVVLEADSLRSSGTGLDLDVRMPWYRSLPLSCVEHLEIEVDDVPVDLAGASLTVDGTSHRLDELAGRDDTVWFIQDRGRVHVPDATVTPGESHRIRFRIDLRIPYIIMGPESALTHSVTVEKTLDAH